MDLDTDTAPFTKVNSKWMVNINLKCKTIKLLPGYIREKLDDFGFGDYFGWVW